MPMTANGTRTLLTTLLLCVSARAGTTQQPVRTRSGPIVGTRNGDVTAYKGIPYAAPPVGNLRWKPPRPAPRWDNVREAKTFGLPCPQPAFGPTPWAKDWSEDCLTINVWTPAATPSRPMPLLVVIPGGGFFGGGSSDPRTNGRELAKRGVVVVSFNHRIGVFGFLAHPALSNESPTHASGNYGLMDQVAALQWVQSNIGAFGGDIAALRALSAAELLTRSQTRTDLMYTDGFDYWPIVDGVVLPDEPAALFDAGRFARTPLIIGTNTDEATVFAFTLPIKTADAWREHVAKRSPGAEAAAKSTYAAPTDADVHAAAVHWVNDWYFHGSARAVARAVSSRGVPVFLYGFSRVPPGQPMRSGVGAFHSAELEYCSPRSRRRGENPSCSRKRTARWPAR